MPNLARPDAGILRVLQIGPEDPREFGPVLQCLQSLAADGCRVIREQIDSRELSDRLPGPPPDWVVVLQCWPDEVRTAQAERLIGQWPLARVLCVYGSWCNSDARTRAIWPPAWRVPATEAMTRLQSEWDLLLADRAGVPATASREEAFAWTHLGGMNRLLGLVVAAVIVTAGGCSSEPPPLEPIPVGGQVAMPFIAPESPWSDQLTAVRAGDSSEIRLQTPVTAEEWRELATGCEGLMVLDLPEASVADAELALLPSLVSLRQLVLGGPVGDAGLATLSQCPSLEIVNLPRAQFTDAGLAHLKQLPLLTLLRFGSPHVTDAGLEHLAEMPNLRFVHLLNVPITDAGLEPLKRCELLESFYIDGSRCSDEGLSCLLQARPGLHLHVNQLHLPGDEHGDETPAAP